MLTPPAVVLTFVALTIVPFLALELWFFIKATRQMPELDREAEQEQEQ